MLRQNDYPARIVILLALNATQGSELVASFASRRISLSMRQPFSSCLPLQGSLCSPAESLRTLRLCVRFFFPLPLADFLFHLTGLPPVTSLPKASAKGHVSSVVRGSSPVTRHESPVTNSFICHRSEETPCKSFPCHTSKTPLPQVLCLPHIQDPPGAPAPAPHRHPKPHPESSSRVAGEGAALSFVFRVSYFVFRISYFSLLLSLGASHV